MNELEPCPFCGHDAFVCRDTRGYWLAGCFNNLVCDVTPKSEQLTRDLAIEKWNTRANPWHIGTPTYGGRYLVSNGYDTSISYFDGKEFVKDFLGFPDVGDIVKWQKIEP